MKHFFFRCNLGRTLCCAGQYGAYITGDPYSAQGGWTQRGTAHLCSSERWRARRFVTLWDNLVTSPSVSHCWSIRHKLTKVANKRLLNLNWNAELRFLHRLQSSQMLMCFPVTCYYSNIPPHAFSQSLPTDVLTASQNRLPALSLKKNSMVWVRERTIPTERPPLVGEVIANFCG
jgi:hypothetical protein